MYGMPTGSVQSGRPDRYVRWVMWGARAMLATEIQIVVQVDMSNPTAAGNCATYQQHLSPLHSNKRQAEQPDSSCSRSARA